MTTWMTLDEHAAYRATLTPIGLWLEPFFHVTALVQPEVWYRRAGDERPEDGLGMSWVWCGVSNGMPFEVVQMLDYRGERTGFSVALPSFASGERARFAALERLDVPAWSRPSFRRWPERGRVGVFALGAVAPVYMTHERAAAEACLSFLRRRSPVPSEVRESRDEPACWFVDGPRTLDYISIRFAVETREEADAEARRLAKRHGCEFQVVDPRQGEPEQPPPVLPAARVVRK